MTQLPLDSEPDPYRGFQVERHRQVTKFLRKHLDLLAKWDDIVKSVCANPRFGPHRDHLKGAWNCSHRWDEGDYRIKYEIADGGNTIHFYDANTRGQAYRSGTGEKRR